MFKSYLNLNFKEDGIMSFLNKIKKVLLSSIAMSSILIFSACDSSSTTKSANFIDNAVKGIFYITNSISDTYELYVIRF